MFHMIKFLDLKKVNARFKEEYEDVFNRFLNSGNYILGEEVSKFESAFKLYCGTGHCIGTSNGLDALRLIFEGYKILGKLHDGDEILVPANTYIASVLAISSANLKPILVEPDSISFNIDVHKAKSALTHKTKAILGVHLYGQLYDVHGLETLCKEQDLILIEDAAQAHGSSCFDGRKAGNVSDAAAFSFYPTKNLGALGDAGAVTTNDSALAEVVNKLRNYGRTSVYDNDLKGYNCRLDALQAAFLRIKLNHLDSDNQKRRSIAQQYLSLIDNDQISLPQFTHINEHVFHLFVIKNVNRDRLKSYLFENGVETFIHYPKAIHHQKAYSHLKTLHLPITSKLHNEILSLPLNTYLKSSEIEKIANLLTNFR